MSTINPYSNAAKQSFNGSQAAESALAKAVTEKHAELWVAENAKAFDCWNAYVEKNGLPLAKHRDF